MKLYKISFFICFAVLFNACTPKLQTTTFRLTEPTNLSPKTYKILNKRGKNLWADYLPAKGEEAFLPMRTVRLNFHIMRDSANRYGMDPVSGRSYIKELLELANMDLDTNHRNWRSPEGTAVLPRRYQYVLTPQPDDPNDDGIYVHNDNDLCYYVVMGKQQNNYSREVIKKYGIGTDSIVNIFIQPHHPDSIGRPTYRAKRQGIALGTSVKVAGTMELDNPASWIKGMFNHEVGHVLGLPHAWGHDGCDDTEKHPNKCWEWSPEGFCSENATNNMMDYNAYQIAQTPCQIGKIHANFSNPYQKIRRLLVENWCERKPEMDIYINKNMAFEGARDLEGNITIGPKGYLLIDNRISLPKDASITIKPGGVLELGEFGYLHNACDLPWKGVLIQKSNGLEGKVIAHPKARIRYPQK